MLRFNADAIFTSSISKSGKSRPSIDHDGISSSTALATSTSFVHNIAIARQPESDHTSVLKLVFQHWKSDVSGNFSNAILKFDSSASQSYNFEDKCLLHDMEDSRLKTSWQSEELVLHNSEVLFSTPLFAPQFLPVSIGFNMQEEEDARFFEFSKSAGRSRASRLS